MTSWATGGHLGSAGPTGSHHISLYMSDEIYISGMTCLGSLSYSHQMLLKIYSSGRWFSTTKSPYHTLTWAHIRFDSHKQKLKSKFPTGSDAYNPACSLPLTMKMGPIFCQASDYEYFHAKSEDRRTVCLYPIWCPHGGDGEDYCHLECDAV
jgi:hypothetical protein